MADLHANYLSFGCKQSSPVSTLMGNCERCNVG